MNLNYRLSIILIISVLTLPGAGYAAPVYTPTIKNFSVGSSYGARTTFSFMIREPGCIWAKASWSGTADRLSLILNGPNQTLAYNRQDGSSGLALAYSVKDDDLDGDTRPQPWVLTIANFGGGTAQGTITIEIPPNQVPCGLEARPGISAGQVMLNWRYTSQSQPVFFLVERSTNDINWNSVVLECKLRPSTLQSYSCSDNSGLNSNALYYYRACSVLSTSASRCGPVNVSPSVSVIAP